ncbi:Hypothetical predicted protein [Paramuricea clavata]|uniref:Uncharacterized protein n=1 Tax=Paramuricea clavata TaxID=317549 RepID=A0A7D9DAJ8_PARCT|nr:Hypothetical predicted protein [Paramuricea clavata]
MRNKCVKLARQRDKFMIKKSASVADHISDVLIVLFFFYEVELAWFTIKKSAGSHLGCLDRAFLFLQSGISVCTATFGKSNLNHRYKENGDDSKELAYKSQIGKICLAPVGLGNIWKKREYALINALYN